MALIDACLENALCFTRETTLSGRETLDAVKRAIARDYYFRLYLYYVGLDIMGKSLLRVENRVRRGGHNINTDTVMKYKNGELQTIGQDSPKWLLELIEKMK